MPRRIDLRGQRFGSLTAIKEGTPLISKDGRSRARWLCRCDCGAETLVITDALRGGRIKSCGCSKIRDLTGQRFGKLVVQHIMPREKWKHNQADWKCICDCGNECIVMGASLTSGDTTSCGCLRKELAAKATCDRCTQIMVGKKLGRLTVVARDNQNSKRYICRCECGREISVSMKSLHSPYAGSLSCGCKDNSKRRKQMYEEVTGRTAKRDDRIIFLDGNTLNTSAANLASIPTSIWKQMRRGDLFSSNPELTQTALKACMLVNTISKMRQDS